MSQHEEICPCCNRSVPLSVIARNTKRERIFEWHFDDNERQCIGSYKSLRDALAAIHEADKLANG